MAAGRDNQCLMAMVRLSFLVHAVEHLAGGIDGVVLPGGRLKPGQPLGLRGTGDGPTECRATVSGFHRWKPSAQRSAVQVTPVVARYLVCGSG